ncbi:MAG: hypothetical protein IJ403_01665 [Oscillospiraceae bacterium]|nr:hypothetical protein [Oscillospiraceae bacterium]
MDNHCCICGAYLTDTGRMICEKCENLQQADVKPCPRCGEVPHIGYACGEYFIMGVTEGCPVCDGFTEMHSSEEQEIYAWNRRAEDG